MRSIIKQLKHSGLIQLLPITADRALDVGCGNGAQAKELAEEGYRVDAVDIKLHPGKERHTHKDITYYETSIQDFLKKENKYDIIIANNVLPFMGAEIGSVLDKLINSLNEGGLIYFTMFGVKDGWFDAKERNNLIFLEKPEIIERQYPILWREEMLGPGPMMNGQIKRWHIYRFIASK